MLNSSLRIFTKCLTKNDDRLFEGCYSFVFLKDLLSILVSSREEGQIDIAMSTGSIKAISAITNSLLVMGEGNIQTLLLSLYSSDENLIIPRSVSYENTEKIFKAFLLSQVSNNISVATTAKDDLVSRLFNQCLLVLHNNNNRDISSSTDLIWTEVVGMCCVGAVWMVLSAVQLASLMAKYQISLLELRAIQSRFFQYDDELRGVISVSSLQGLLKVSFQCLLYKNLELCLL